MKKFLGVMAGIFFILSIVFYANSVHSVGYGSSRMDVANVQMTVFSAACAIMFVINVVGAIVLSGIESMLNGETPSILSKLESLASPSSEKDSAENTDNDKQTYHEAAEKEMEITWQADAKDPSWVICPDCGSKAPKSFITEQKKCPFCGCSANKA